jgi:hypothetical protein
MKEIKHTDAYKKQSVQETLSHLNVDFALGLNEKEIINRQVRVGMNKIEEHEEP